MKVVYTSYLFFLHSNARVSVSSLWFHILPYTYAIITSPDIKDNLSCLNIVPSNNHVKVIHVSLTV